MGDYLNNIVSRSLSVADVVQPRVPHLFEQTSAAMPEEVAPAPVEGVAETMAASEVQPTSYPATPVAQINMEVRPPFPEQFRAEPEAAAMPPTPVLLQPPMPTPEITKTKTDPANEQSIQVRPGVPRVPATQQQRHTVIRNAGEITNTVVPSSVRPSATEPAVTPRRSAPVIPSSSVSPAPAPPQPTRTEQQLPPIKINIGRVDVRAIMPAAPPVIPSSPRPKPALSLESYLKQREEGKR